MSLPALAHEQHAEQERRSYFKRRLEAFSDIVFAFSLSELALQLEIPKAISEFRIDPLSFSIFFLTFAIICFFWVAHYRMFRLIFEPYRVDVVLNFVFLAFVAISPYSMQVYIRFAPYSATSGQISPYLLYVMSFIGIALPFALIFYRGLRRRDPAMSERDRLDAYKSLVRNIAIGLVSLVCMVLLFFVRPPYIAMYPYIFLGPIIGVARRRIKHVPARFRPASASV